MAPRFLGNRFKEANHKPSRNLLEWVGFEEKQKTRTHTSTFLRACRALTAWRLTGFAFWSGNINENRNFFLPTNFEGTTTGQVRVETLVIGRIICRFRISLYGRLQVKCGLQRNSYSA